ncbi:YdcF family protein [Ammoniphilus sp. CFH 90114]|uniref:YdcF family protein n=1 Tax=Ammoniphilus sp. CFH 90114 TaxID=2493665 RepID=UPI00100FB20D|nr:YdcF family protein [Ammoniphilus sp. CFH 90114]RXT05216.1 YdcF family protein [Ammoniphilus sp. CFH 90114]
MMRLFLLKNRKWLFPMLAVMLASVAYFGYTSWKIVNTWKTSEGVKSDCLIVLGAAVWNGKPSPAMRERLDVAIELYQNGMAPRIIVSGGVGRGEYSEAEVMRDYLAKQGVPQEDVLIEDRSTSTWENLTFSQDVMKNHGLKSSIIVTHGFHTYRALMMARDIGIKASAEPVMLTPLNVVYYTLRECLALAEYTLKGRWFAGGRYEISFLNREQAATR